MSWLREHLDTFVKPYIPSDFDERPLGYFTPIEHTILKNCWRSEKAQAAGQKILLASKYCWIFEVLARRENYPTLFVPEWSRETYKQLLEDRKSDFEDVYMADFGFAEGVRALVDDIKFRLEGGIRWKISELNCFPALRMKALLHHKITQAPSYWAMPFIVYQTKEICLPTWLTKNTAARLTIEIYKNSSPKFVKDLRSNKVN